MLALPVPQRKRGDWAVRCSEPTDSEVHRCASPTRHPGILQHLEAYPRVEVAGMVMLGQSWQSYASRLLFMWILP